MRSDKYLRAGFVALAACLLLLQFACGRKGDPRPPEEFAPGQVLSLTATGSLEGIALSWAAPELTPRGEVVRDLAGFIVRRAAIKEGERPRFVRLVDLSIKAEDEYLAEGQSRVDGLRQYSYLDKDVEPGQRYHYLVIPYNTRGVLGQSSYVLRVTFIGESSIVEGVRR